MPAENIIRGDEETHVLLERAMVGCPTRVLLVMRSRFKWRAGSRLKTLQFASNSLSCPAKRAGKHNLSRSVYVSRALR